MSGKTIVVLPDSHAHPDYHNRRYEWFGRLLDDTKPDHCVDIGDFGDFPSLSSYDKGKKSYEGRRYKKDVDAFLDAQEKILHPLRQSKKKLPKFWRTLGNHENRITRALEVDPVLEGTIGLSDLQSREHHWEEIPFLVPLEIEGIRFCHYFTTGVKNLPVGGAHQASTLLAKEHTSCIMGHTHTRDSAIQHAGNKFIQALVVGCYQDYRSEWAGPANDKWNSGAYILRNVQDGMFDEQWVSMKALREAYG